MLSEILEKYALAINKEVLRLCGVEAAFLLSFLISFGSDYEEVNEIEDGWFPVTRNQIELEIGLSKHKQREAIKKLLQAGLILMEYRKLTTSTYRDVPPQMHYKILPV